MVKIKKGLYTIKNWYIAKIKNKWYLLSCSEYQENKNNLENFLKKYITLGFGSRKELIRKYKSELFYTYIFE